MYRSILFQRARLLSVALVILPALYVLASQAPPQNAQRSPSETVRQFYKAMREGHFRDAFALSIYRPAVNGLTDQEFQALRPLFKHLSDSQFAALRPKYQKLTD